MKIDDVDPMAYIEGAFLDAEAEAKAKRPAAEKAEKAPRPKREESLLVEAVRKARPVEEVGEPINPPSKLKKTGMRAPRPRRASKKQARAPLPTYVSELIQRAPKNMTFLASLYDDGVTQKYYSSKFSETREELIRRMLDPELNLEDTARLLGVCPATVRRYTNRGWLKHHRTKGNQRRFTLTGIVEFVEEYGRDPS